MIQDATTCESFVERMWLYLDGELSGSERERWDQHLAKCSACRKRLNEVKLVSDVYARAGLVDAPSAGLRRVVSECQGLALSGETRGEHSVWWYLISAAAVFVMLLSRPSIISIGVADRIAGEPPRTTAIPYGLPGMRDLIERPDEYVREKRKMGSALSKLAKPVTSGWIDKVLQGTNEDRTQ